MQQEYLPTMEKTFSVIVPVFNTEHYIKECVESIIHSTFSNWELLLIDDGSSDHSGQICDMFSHKDNRIRVFHQNNQGVSAARNSGIEKATGEWLVFVDSDDFITPNMLEMISGTIHEMNADIVFTDFNIVCSDKIELFRTYSWSQDKESSFRKYLTRSWPRVAWGAVRKSMIMNNSIRFPENLTVFEDFHFMCHCILHSRKVIKISEPLYNYRTTNASSITHTMTTQKKKDDEKWVYEDIFRILKSTNQYDSYAASFYWRMLYGKQSMAMETSLHDEFISFFPEKRKYILSCPTIGLKMKLTMWCLTHHLSFVSRLAICINKGLKRALQ